jgi:hypothetical protein
MGTEAYVQKVLRAKLAVLEKKPTKKRPLIFFDARTRRLFFLNDSNKGFVHFKRVNTVVMLITYLRTSWFRAKDVVVGFSIFVPQEIPLYDEVKINDILDWILEHQEEFAPYHGLIFGQYEPKFRRWSRGKTVTLPTKC